MAETFEEEPVIFDSSHYKNGLNGDFLAAAEDGLDLITKYAGGKAGGGGKFEDTEQRDIAKGKGAIMRTLLDVAPVPPGGTILDLGAGTGLSLKGLSDLVPNGQLIAADLSSDFRAWMSARVAVENLSNVQVVACTSRDPLPEAAAETLDLAIMVDVYHHVEYPKTVCRRLRSLLRPGTGRLVVIDFHRDPERVLSHPPEWALQHLRAGQEVFREEILSSGFVLEAEPEIAELAENYVMVFRPMAQDELSAHFAASVGAGWARAPLPVVAP